MANVTPNYNLTKPLITEKYNVSVFNANADKVDAELLKTNSSLAAVTNRVDDIITTPVPTGEVIAQEIMDARQGEGSVGANITGIKSQLADIANKKSFSELFPTFGLSDKDFMYSINVLGDSISHGANAPLIYDQSWVNLLKKAFLNYTNSNNWGYINPLCEISNAMGTYRDWLSVNTTIIGVTDPNVIGRYKYVMTGVNTITLTPRSYKKVNRVGFEFQKIATNGSVKIYIDNILNTTFDVLAATGTNSAVRNFIDIKTGIFSSIKLENVSGENPFVGAFFFDDVLKPVLNNYSLSGSSLFYTGDNVLDRVFDTNIMIFALGHNDSFAAEDITAKLNTCYAKWNVKKPFLIVLDFIWETDKQATSDKLKAFCDSCGGVYIEPFGNKVVDAQTFIDLGLLSDTSHPTIYGHRVIANKVAQALGIYSDMGSESTIYDQKNTYVTPNQPVVLAILTVKECLVERTNDVIRINLETTAGSITNGTVIFTYAKTKTPWLNFWGKGYNTATTAWEDVCIQADDLGRFVCTTVGKTFSKIVINLNYKISN